jgi:hypothetical protein
MVAWKLQASAAGGAVPRPIRLIIAKVNSEFEDLLIFIVVTPFSIKKFSYKRSFRTLKTSGKKYINIPEASR